MCHLWKRQRGFGEVVTEMVKEVLWKIEGLSWAWNPRKISEGKRERRERRDTMIEGQI